MRSGMQARSVFFQLCFALFACQHRFHMRHYDVKLLNLFVKVRRPSVRNMRPALTRAARLQSMPETDVHYVIGGERFTLQRWCAASLPPPPTRPPRAPPLMHARKRSDKLIKLADYGSAEVAKGSLGGPVSVKHITTLENTPLDFLLLGAGARQGYAADVWAAGLSLLHLATGGAPYEELLEAVRCPPALRDVVVEGALGGVSVAACRCRRRR